MIDTRTNELRPAGTLEPIEQVPPAHRGPGFSRGEVVPLKGIAFEIVAVSQEGMMLRPIGKAPEQPRRLNRARRAKRRK